MFACEEISGRVARVLVEALNVEDDELTPVQDRWPHTRYNHYHRNPGRQRRRPSGPSCGD
jgi:hypothetical protein